MINDSKTAARARRLLCALTAIFVVLVLLIVPASTGTGTNTAQALTTDKTTARPNDSEGDKIIGGMPTRITWEGTIDKDEHVTQLVLEFPVGCTLTDSTVATVTLLDGLARVGVSPVINITSERLMLDFAEPTPANLLLRIEITDFCLPAQGGQYSIAGSYTTALGVTAELSANGVISVIGVTAEQSIINWLDEQPWVEAWNSVDFMRIFLNPQMAVAAVPTLFIGWLRSFGLVLVGFPLAIPIGFAISFLRMSKLRILRFVSSLYVNLIRGTPLFLQIYIAFFGLPLMGIDLDSYLLGCLVLAMNSSAYLAEIFRAGIQSIHKGQFEASASLGMSGPKTMFWVIIPQTVRRVIPTATSEFILLYKDTSLLAAVGVMEMMMFGKSLVAGTGNMTPYIIAAFYYLLVTLPLTKIISSFEAKLARAEGSGEAPTKKKRIGLFTRPTRSDEINSEIASEVRAGSLDGGSLVALEDAEVASGMLVTQPRKSGEDR